MILNSRKTYSEINNYISNLSSNNIPLSEHLRFRNMCGTRGVQGYVGVFSLRDDNKLPSLKETKTTKEDKKVIFKFSKDIDFSTEHEAMILSEISKLNCPHFVNYYTIFEGKVSKDFFHNQHNQKQFLVKGGDYLPYSILLMEHINNDIYNIKTLDSLVRGDPKNILRHNVYKKKKFKQHVVVSQLLQTLISLEIGQLYYDFTHYDIHTDNILEMKCEPNSVIIYKYSENINENEKKVHYQIVPTYGFYPKIIDLGMSYCSKINGKNIYTTLGNYNNGAQSGIFDPLNDVHHLMISVLNDLEEEEEELSEESGLSNKLFRTIANNVRTTFSSIKILIRKGWKQLPYEILDQIVDTVNNYDKNIFKNYIIEECKLIDMFCHLIVLPFTEYDEYINFEKYLDDGMIYVLSEVQKNIDNNDVDKFLLCMKDLIFAYNEVSDSDEFEKKYKLSFSAKNELINFDYKKIFDSFGIISKQLSTFVYPIIREHLDLVKDAYDIIAKRFRSPVDMFHFVYQNLTPHFVIDEETLIYIYDADTGNMTCDKMGKDRIEKDKNINKYNRFRKAKVVYDMIKTN
jgi:hypothetical protein